MGPTTWVLLAVIGAALFVGGEAISCYACSSSKMDCHDDPVLTSADVTKITTYSTGNDCAMCFKSKLEQYGYHTVSRGCYGTTYSQTWKLGCFSHEDETSGERTTICTCDTADCNHANSASVSIAMIIGMFALFKLFQ